MQASMQPQLASAEVASRLEVAGTCQELPSGEQLALDMNMRLKHPEQCCKALLHQGQVCNFLEILSIVMSCQCCDRPAII